MIITASQDERGKYYIFQINNFRTFRTLESSVLVINNTLVINNNPELLEMNPQLKKKILAFHKNKN